MLFLQHAQANGDGGVFNGESLWPSLSRFLIVEALISAALNDALRRSERIRVCGIIEASSQSWIRWVERIRECEV